MSTVSTPVQPLLQNAAAALQRGDKRGARHWAQQAASLAPHSEEPWLLLAAVSEPRASLEYLRQALRVNPGSERALRGVRWAQSRLAKQQAESLELTKPVKTQPLPPPAVVTQPTNLTRSREGAKPQGKEGAKSQGKEKEIETLRLGVFAPLRFSFLSGRRLLVLPVIFVALLCLALAWAALPAGKSFAQSLIHSATPTADLADGPAWSQAEIAKPAAPANVVPLASLVGAPTATPPALSTVAEPAATSTPLPTDPPTPTALPTDTVAPGGRQPAPGVVAPSAPGAGKYILVSISQQHLYAYQDGALVSSFVASTGMNNSTRAGVFQVLDKIPNAYGATWNIWMPNWLGIYYSGSLENGIHALPILSNGARLWAGYLGTPISFGCVVLGVDESLWLYNWADIGTTVEIRR